VIYITRKANESILLVIKGTNPIVLVTAISDLTFSSSDSDFSIEEDFIRMKSSSYSKKKYTGIT